MQVKVKVLLSSDIEQNIVKSYGVHGPRRNMMGYCLVETSEVSEVPL